MIGQNMRVSTEFGGISRVIAGLLCSTVLVTAPQMALAAPKVAKVAAPKPAPKPAPIPDAAPAPTPPPAPVVVAAPAPVVVIRSIVIEGVQRLEADTVRSYITMRLGDAYSEVAADQALKDLFATELFADVQVRNDGGQVVITVKENPVINRIILEGNKHLKEEKINPEIKLAARQIFTRSKVRADVARIIELYKRQGRFGASVEPKMVQLDQNRVDIVFEINEGPKSKVRKINIIGNSHFKDGKLQGVMLTKQVSINFFKSGTSYDPDKMAYDQQKLRQFYLTQGYADFRVVSATAELTPDKKDFIITYVVEEGKRYKFGNVKVESQLREFDGEELAKRLPMKKGDWYDAKQVEDTIDKLNETAGIFGYAFADTRPNYDRNGKELTMGITFNIAEAPRVYVERVDVNGNTLTQDKVVRREFRLAEGDAFNSLQVKRTTNRIKSLGYFQEKFEVQQKPGSDKDRIILEANVEEKPTGELQLSAGYSSLESFIFQSSVQQRNFRGRGQTIGLSGSISRYSKSIEASFTEPYFRDKNVAFGINIYRRDLNNYNNIGSNSNTIYRQATTGFQARLGLPLNEYLSFVTRYTLNYDDVSLDKNQFYSINALGQFACDPLLSSRYLCEAEGKRTSSILGASLVYDNLDNRVHPSRGRSGSINMDFAGLGGSVKYIRLRTNAAQYWPVGKGFIFSLTGEAGIIKPLAKRNIANEDDVLLTDRFFLGEPQIRGFDIRGVGPRIIRKPLIDDGTNTGTLIPTTDRNTWYDDSIGGRYYYMTRAELEIPLGSGAKELGIRPSIFIDAGAVWGVTTPLTTTAATGIFTPTRDTSGNPLFTQIDTAALDTLGNCVASATSVVTNATNPTPPSCLTSAANRALGNTIPPFKEYFYGNTPRPRVSIGIGFNWNSPFGPFRIDFAKALMHSPGDNTKSFTFNVGTQF
jgi:outer membrane protein insertion porin family